MHLHKTHQAERMHLQHKTTCEAHADCLLLVADDQHSNILLSIEQTKKPSNDNSLSMSFYKIHGFVTWLSRKLMIHIRS
jgi:hypothetical protein